MSWQSGLNIRKPQLTELLAKVALEFDEPHEEDEDVQLLDACCALGLTNERDRLLDELERIKRDPFTKVVGEEA